MPPPGPRHASSFARARRAARPVDDDLRASSSARRAARAVAAGDGQAAVEVVALLPVLAVLLASAWQAVLAGHAVWAANAAARAAARAHAVGADPRAAARSRLPSSLEPGLRVSTERGGDVRVTVRIPSLPGLPSPGRANAGAHFEPQT